ncbi:hypothetical protein Tco_0221145 [Tanacetum coccineum]
MYTMSDLDVADFIMAQQQDVPRDSLYPPQKKYDVMDANKKFYLDGIYYSYSHPTRLIPYPRFTKIIIDYYMTENPEIPRRLHEHYHRVENDEVIKKIFNSGKNKEGKGMKIPDWMLTKEMKQTAHYKITPGTLNPNTTEGESSAQRKLTVIRFLVSRRQDPETPIQTSVEIDITNLNEAT